MGRFAALLFCSMICRGKVIAFAPQTFISQEKRGKYSDNRWPLQIQKLHETRSESDIYDLKQWIQSRFPELQARIYASTSDVLDIAHANELACFSNVDVFQFSEGGHDIVKKLRDDGALKEILNW